MPGPERRHEPRAHSPAQKMELFHWALHSPLLRFKQTINLRVRLLRMKEHTPCIPHTILFFCRTSRGGDAVKAIHEMYPWIEVQTLSGTIEEAIQTVTTTKRRIISLFGNCRNLSQDRSRACSMTSCGMFPELSSLAPSMMLFFLSGLVEHTWPFETRLDGKRENKRHMVTVVNPFAWFSNE